MISFNSPEEQSSQSGLTFDKLKKFVNIIKKSQADYNEKQWEKQSKCFHLWEFNPYSPGWMFCNRCGANKEE